MHCLNLAANNKLARSYRELIQRSLAPHLSHQFGYHALLYSPLAKDLCEQNLSIKHQLVIGNQGHDLSLKCCYQELPIACDVIDLAILPNILQQELKPHQVLREVERVLIPEGLIILVARNPYSWQGIKNKLIEFQAKGKHEVFDISQSRIIDWFGLLGFKVENKISISRNNDNIQKSKLYPWIKRLAEYFSVYFCSYYIIVARKKVSTLMPIRPSWRRDEQLVSPRFARSRLTPIPKRLGNAEKSGFDLFENEDLAKPIVGQNKEKCFE